MAKSHIVSISSGDLFEVTADHELVFNHGTVGCSLVLHSIKPKSRMDVAVTDSLREELESALAYKIIDEYYDGEVEAEGEEIEGYPC